MRILQVHAGYRVAAGEDTVVANEAAALRRGGHTVEQFIVPNPSGTAASLSALARSVHNRTTARAVADLIGRTQPDVLHVHNTWFALSPSVLGAATAASVPVVMTVHNYRLGCLGADLFREGGVCTACVGRTPWSGVVHGCYRGSRVLSAVQAVEVMATRARRVLDRAVTTFVAPSAFMADRLVDIGVARDRLVVKPHFTGDPGPRPEPPSRSTEVLFVGRLAPGKGIETLLTAWTMLPPSPSWATPRLSVVGDGPSADALRNGAPGNVRFHGWLTRDEVTTRLLGARALVFPSEWYEPFGMVLIEAMAAGLPIVATNVSAAADISGSPLVVPARRADLLADALAQLDDRTVDELGAVARRRFADRFSERAGLDALEHLYRDAIDRHGMQ